MPMHSEESKSDAITYPPLSDWNGQLAKDWSLAECMARVDEMTLFSMLPHPSELNNLNAHMRAVDRLQSYLADLNRYNAMTALPPMQGARQERDKDAGDKCSLVNMSLRKFEKAMRYETIIQTLSAEFGLGILLYIPPSWTRNFLHHMSTRHFDMLRQFLRTSAKSHHLRYFFDSANHIVRHFGDEEPIHMRAESRLLVYAIRDGLYRISDFPYIPENGVCVQLEIRRDDYDWRIRYEEGNPQYPERLSMKKTRQEFDITITRHDIESLRPGNSVTRAAMALLMVLIDCGRDTRGPRLAYSLPEQFSPESGLVKLDGTPVTDDEVHIPVLVKNDSEYWIMLFIEWSGHRAWIYDPSFKYRLPFGGLLKDILACAPPPHPDWPQYEHSFYRISGYEGFPTPENDCDSGILVLKYFQQLGQSEESNIPSINELRHEYRRMLVDEIWDKLETGGKDAECIP